MIIGYSVFTCPAAIVGGFMSKLTLRFEKNEFSSKAPRIRKINPEQEFFKSSFFYFAVGGVAPFRYLNPNPSKPNN